MGARTSRFLAGGDHRFGLPDSEKVFALSLDDVRDWLRQPLGSGYLEVTLLGDLDVDEAIAAAAGTLGTLPEREAGKPDLSEFRAVSFPEDEERADFPFASDIPSGYAAVYWPTTDMWDIQRTRRLTVLARVFSDRMRIRIREEMGEAYSPFAGSQPSDTFDDYGLLFALIGIDPEKAEEVADVVLEIASDLHTGEISDDELDRAVQPILTSVRTAVRENDYWMNSVLASSQEFPRRIEWARTMLEDFQNIGREDVEALARRFLDPDKGLRVFIVPTTDEAAVGTGSD